MIKNSELQELVEQGIISPEQLKKITTFQAESDSAGGWFSQSIVTIWTILVWLGVLSLVALNREWMTDLLKISLLLITTIISYLVGRYFKNKGKKLIWWSLLFLSWLLIGTSIFLVAQVYNLTVTNDLLLGIWIICILPLVYLLRQKEFAYLYLILLSCVLAQFLMSHVFPESDRRDPIVLYMLFGVGLVFTWYVHAAYYDDELLIKLYKVFGVNIALISYFIYIVSSSFEDTAYLLPSSLIRISLWLLCLLLLRWFFKKERDMWYMISALIAVMVGVIVHQVVFINYCVFILLCLVIIFLWYKHHNTLVIRMANIYLYVFLLYLYGRYGWEYENKAIFFIWWGILMIALGVWFSKLNKALLSLLAPVLTHD